jgi:putative protease
LMIDQGLARFTVSLESTFADILALLASGMSVDVIVHGPQCALITDLCLIKAVAGDAQKPCSVSCQEEGAFLIDELGQYYMIYSDDQCRNHIFLPNDICLYNYLPVLAKDAANGLRIEGQYMPASDLYEVVSIYQEGLQQLSQGRWESGEPYQRLLNCYPQGLTSGCFVGR